MTYSTVVVGTDGSESSYRAVDKAAEVASGVGATLLLAAAYHPMSRREQQRAADALGEEAYLVTGSTPAEDLLREACDRAKAAGVKDPKTVAVEATRSTRCSNSSR